VANNIKTIFIIIIEVNISSVINNLLRVTCGTR